MPALDLPRALSALKLRLDTLQGQALIEAVAGMPLRIVPGADSPFPSANLSRAFFPNLGDPAQPDAPQRVVARFGAAGVPHFLV